MGESKSIRNGPPGAFASDGPELLDTLIRGTSAPGVSDPAIPGVVVGKLIGIGEGGNIPLIYYPGQPGTEALPARSVVDLRGAHVGRQIVLVFESGDSTKPIIIGVLRESDGWPLADPPGQVEVDADGQRLIVDAKEQLVLNCGKASLTLRRDGRIEIRGETIVSQAAGANRVRGGSVELN